MSRSEENIMTEWQGLSGVIGSHNFYSQIPNANKPIFEKIRTNEIVTSWDGLKGVISENAFRESLPSYKNKELFRTYLRTRKAPRENNSAKVVPVANLSKLMKGFFNVSDKEDYVAKLSDSDENALLSYLIKSPHFPRRLLKFFTRSAKSVGPVSKAVARPIRRAVVIPRVAPPGYEYIQTKGDGDCMFYSVYYAWNPQEGTAKAQEGASSLSIRQILANEVVADDTDPAVLVSDLKESIELTKDKDPKQAADLQNYVNQIDAILASNQTFARKRQLTLALYKQFILLQGFWGTSRELEILNRYGQRNGKPFIWIFNGQHNESYRLDPATGQFIPNGHPIHFNGYNHYSILKAIDTPEAAQKRRNANAVLASQFVASAEEIARGERAVKRQALTARIVEFLASRDVDKVLRESIASSVGDQYNGLKDINSATSVGKAKALEKGVAQPLADELATEIRKKIDELQGGKRKTRRVRKITRRTTRKQ